MLIYLAGAMSCYDRGNCFEKATEWRDYVTNYFDCNECNIHTFNPCVNFSTNKEFNTKGILNQNITYLKGSDIILVNLDEIDTSFGTIFEVYYGYMHNIPVIAFNSNYLVGLQPHITESLTMEFENIVDATEYIQSMYAQDNK